MMINVLGTVLENKPLSTSEIETAVKELKIKNFKGVFLRDTLPTNIPNQNECGILNLDRSFGPGTHWVCWYKQDDLKLYFDSYGILPPLELQKYLGKNIFYNTDQIQKSGVVCGHLCLYILKKLDLDCCVNIDSYYKIIQNLF